MQTLLSQFQLKIWNRSTCSGCQKQLNSLNKRMLDVKGSALNVLGQRGVLKPSPCSTSDAKTEGFFWKFCPLGINHALISASQVV